MYILLGMVFLSAAVIALIEFPPIIKEKRYGNLVIVSSFWLGAVALSSLQILGFELIDPLDTFVSMLPPFFDPIIEFLLP